MRWAQYCQEFNDPLSNNGVSACAGNTPGIIVNGDISIESFLLKDTIDMNNPDEYKTAQALLLNIVEPDIQERVADSLLGTVPGRERVIRQQHLDAVRNVAADVVASIISRRAALPPTNVAIATQIAVIRKNAGIDPADISAAPSYNEIMEAMTKERFFDQAYFFYLQNNIGALQQEQATVDGYTAIQLQDIYRMQEQINALLSARAALKLSTDASGSQTPASPN